MLFKLHTENMGSKGVKNIENACNRHFAGYTITKGNIGYWKGKKEKSLCVEISARNIKKTTIAINSIVKEIKQKNKQEAVLVQKFNVPQLFI